MVLLVFLYLLNHIASSPPPFALVLCVVALYAQRLEVIHPIILWVPVLMMNQCSRGDTGGYFTAFTQGIYAQLIIAYLVPPVVIATLWC